MGNKPKNIEKMKIIFALLLISSTLCLSIPAPVKKAMAGVWGAVKPEVKTLGVCMAKAVKAKAFSMLPSSAQAFLKLVGARRLGFMSKIKGAVKGAAKKAAGAARGLACKAFGGKALAMCKSAVAAGVGKAQAAIKKKFPKVDLPGSKKCLIAFGDALCTKAEKKACGRRLLSIPGPVKKAMSSVWGAVKGEVKTLGVCMAKAVKAKAFSMLPSSAQAFLKLVGARRLGFMSKIKGAVKGAAKKAAGAAKGLACKAFGGKALAMCKSAVAAGVGKAQAAIKKKFPKVDLPGSKKCLIA